VRVVGGTARGRRLRAPAGGSIRPTADRVREAVFDMIRSRRAVEGATVADLFAGTGALGIEALSLGATSVTFVDRDAEAIRAIRANLASTGLGDAEDQGRVRVVRSDVLRWLEGHGDEPFDLALCDPPYGFEAWDEVLERLGAALAVLEADRQLPLGAGWETLKTKRYGGTVVTLARRFPDNAKGPM